MRICLVYDCLFPHTVGGLERVYRSLALRLAADGHEVTYLTLRQWDDEPDLPGVSVVVAGPRMRLYSGPGQRRTLPPLVFGAGVLWHLLRHGRRYDTVHTAAFPYFSLLAAGLVRPLHRYGLVVDWLELWSRAYWREYLGAIGGRIGWLVQKLCLKVPQRAYCYAQVTERRLREEGIRGGVTALEGLYTGPVTPPVAAPAEALVVFAGRHIPEKRAPAAAAGIAEAARRSPGLRGIVFGDGPDRPAPSPDVELPGFVDQEELQTTLARSLCLLHPSQREGYGLVVVEAASHGVPSILVRHPDNAATELVEEGVNGFVVDSDDPDTLADAILRVRDAGAGLRESTADWFERNAGRLSLDTTLDAVAAAYAARS